MRFPPAKGCYRCAWHAKGGRFLCRWPFGLWDVSAAEGAVRRLRGRGRLRVVRVSWLTLRRLALRDGWFGGRQFYEPHVSHVNTRKAGILGTVRGRPGRRLVLLEGMHRAVRCLRERRDFRAYVLPARETAAVELKAGRRAKAEKNFGAVRPAFSSKAPGTSSARPRQTRRTRAA
ncbi:MAG TPA: hypothetical protein VF736_20230 [Pyrinomonadaceae bacterium]